MSVAKYTFQYKTTISVNRESFLYKVVRNPDLNRKDLRVLLHLMTHLDGMNFKAISKKNIAYDLNISKDDVTKSLENLMDLEVLQSGSSASVEKGYRLLF